MGTIFFAPIARLLGDLVVSLPPLQKLIGQQNKDVCLILRSPAQEGLAQRIYGLKDFIRETDFLRLPELERQHLINLRDHPLQKRFVWGSPEFYKAYPGYGINEIIRQICHDFNIDDGQSELTPLTAWQRHDCQDKFILIPGTAAPIKQWPSQNWLRLHSELKKLGVDSVMIGEPRVNSQISGLMKEGMPWAPTRTLADALDAINSSSGVIAVDTGLMHLAVHQGKRTVAMLRDYTVFARHYAHVKYIVAAKCASTCRSREFAFVPNTDLLFNDWNQGGAIDFWNALRCQLPEEDACMSTITVKTVIEQMKNNNGVL